MNTAATITENIRNFTASITRIVASVYYTIKYNWFYILLSILAPFAIYLMGAGREIIALLFTGPELVLNTCFLILSLALMSASIWLIPSLSIYMITLYGKLMAQISFKSDTDYFLHLINLYSTSAKNPINAGQSQIPVKYLAMLPWTMVLTTLIQLSIDDEVIESSLLVFVALNTVFMSALVIMDQSICKRKKKKSYWLILVLVLLCAAYILYKEIICASSSQILYTIAFEEKMHLIIIFIAYSISMFITFWLLTKGDKIYMNVNAAKPDDVRKCLKKNHLIHASLFFVTLCALIWLTCLAINIKLPCVSTLTVLLLCLNLYMLLVDTLFTSQWVMSAKLKSLIGNGSSLKVVGYKMLVGIIFICFIYLAGFNNTNHYKHQLPQNKHEETATMEAYFDNWYQQKLSNMPVKDKVMNVYLISGQGGGSRAAVYILTVLNRIQKTKDKELYNQTFSISSISGSSAGIGQYIGQHENSMLQTYLTETKTDSFFTQIREAYSYNFFNSNILGLFFYDRIPSCIKDIFVKTHSNTYASFNRNFIQEKEELRQLENFTDSLITDSAKDYSFFQEDIQDLYNRKDAPYATPLVFFNTTVLNQGKKGIFSPIGDTTLFSNNIDLSKPDRPVSFHFAEIASQSFPMLNNFSRINDYYLGDGGLYENSGISTTAQIYRLLKKYCNYKRYKVRFIIINILNGKDKKNDEQYVAAKKTKDTKSIMALILEVFSKMPFAGHESDAKESILQETVTNNRYAAYDAIRDSSFNIQPNVQFALSRVFSRHSLDSFVSLSAIDSSLRVYAACRRYWDSIDNLPSKESKNLSRIYRLYAQYLNKGDKQDVIKLLQNPTIKDLVLSIPPIDLVEGGKYGNEVRYFHPADSINGETLRASLSKISSKPFQLIHVTNKTLSSKTPDGQLELWIQSLK